MPVTISTARKKAILWDNDGVLADTERLFYTVNHEIFLEHGFDLSPRHFADLFLEEGRGAWHLLGLPEERISPLRAERNRRYNMRLIEVTNPYVSGIDHILAKLASDLRMGIVTSARREDFDAIHRSGTLLRYFEFVVTAEDYLSAKPSPDPYLLGLARLGLAADECLVVEDTPRGVRSAKAAGIDCIAIRSELTASCKFDGACCVVESHDQLLDAILAHCGLTSEAP